MLTFSDEPNRGADIAAQKEEKQAAEQGERKGAAVREQAHAVALTPLSLAVKSADQRLASVADALQQHLHDGDRVGDAGIAGDGGLPVIKHTEAVDEHEREHGGEGQPEGRDAHPRDGGGAAAEAAERTEEGELFIQQVGDGFDGP